MQVNNVNDIGNTVATIAFVDYQVTTALAATQAEITIGSIGLGPSGSAIVAQVTPNATFAASDAAYWQFQLFKRTAGGAAVLIAQGSSSATLNNPVTFTAWTPVQMVVQAGAGSFVSPGDAITLTVTKVGAPAAIQFAVAVLPKVN